MLRLARWMPSSSVATHVLCRVLALWPVLLVVPLMPNAAIAGEKEPPCDPECQQAAVGPLIEDCTSCGDPVSMFTGQFSYTHTDLRIEGRGLKLSFERSYNSGSRVNGPLGKRWDFGWNRYVTMTVSPPLTPAYRGPVAETLTAGNAVVGSYRTVHAYYYDGASRIDEFSRRAAGLHQSWGSAPGYFAKLRHEPAVNFQQSEAPHSFTMRSADGTTLVFADADQGRNPFVLGAVFRVSTITDRHGNTLTFTYEDFDPDGVGGIDYKRLAAVQDSLGNYVEFHYRDGAHYCLVDYIADSQGREVHFEYDDATGDLVAVTGPAIDGTPTGNDFTEGRTIRYKYTSADTFTNLLESVFDGNQIEGSTREGENVPFVVNTYEASSGRVTKQVYGGTNTTNVKAGGTQVFVYKHHQSPLLVELDNEFYLRTQETLSVDQNGNLLHICFDRQGRERQKFAYTGRFNPLSVGNMTIDAIISGRTAKLRATDPDFYETQNYYNDDGLIVEKIAPGEHIKTTYYEGPDTFQKGNALRVERLTTKEKDRSPPITTVTAYEPFFNQVRATIDARGLDEFHQSQTDTAPSATAYMTTTLFDYQEGEYKASALEDMRLMWSVDTDQDSQFDLLESLGVTLAPMPLSCGLNDRNDDGIVDQLVGNAICVTKPNVRVHGDPELDRPSYTDQTIVTKYRFNAFSLMTGRTDPREKVISYKYFPVSDPGGVNPTTNAGTSDGGFLGEVNYPEAVTETFRYDALGRRTKHVNGRGAETLTTYNAVDEVIQVENDLGYVTQTIYDAAGRVTAQRRTNKVPVLGGDGTPNGSEGNGASGGMIEDTYLRDLVGNLIEENVQVDSSTTLTTRFRYDRNGNRVLTLLPEFDSDDGNVVSSIYDERGLLWKETRGGLASEFTDSGAHFANSDLATIAGTVDNDGGVSTREMSYDAGMRLTATKDGEGHVWTREYDGFGRLVKTTEPTPILTTVEMVYDAAGNELETTTRDASSTLLRQTKRRFDEVNRCFQVDEKLAAIGVAITIPDGLLTSGDTFVTTRTLFDPSGNAVQLVDDNKHSTFTAYDDLNRAETTTDEIGNQTLTTYDKAGNVIRTQSIEWNSAHSSSESFFTFRFYDKLDRLCEVVDNLGQTARYAYDSRGNKVFESDAKRTSGTVALSLLTNAAEHPSLPSINVNEDGNTTHYAFDDAGRLLTTTIDLRNLGVGEENVIDTIVTQQEFDANGRLRIQRDDNGNETTYVYDGLDRLKTTTYEDGTVESLTYDKNDRIKTRTDANGSVATNFYDEAGRLEKKEHSASGGAVDPGDELMAYDGMGRILSGDDDDSQIDRAYDTLGRVIQETLNGLTTTSIYDGVGNLTRIEYPGGRVIVRGYDEKNRLETVADEGAGAALALYRYAGPRRVESRDYPIPDTRLEYSYDGVKRVDGTHHFRITAATTIDQRTYQWDAASNKTQRVNTVTGLTNDYTYDSSYQLVSSSRHGASTTMQNVSYTLDGIGNRGSVSGGLNAGSYTMSASAPPADFQVNQYTTTPVSANTYDLNGNLTALNTSGNDGAATYDTRNQMIEYDDVGMTTKTHVYRYDVLGRRTAKVVDWTGTPIETRYVYCGSNIIAEANSANVTVTTYVYGRGIDEALSMRRGGSDYFYHADDMGNVTVVVDDSADEQARYDYLDYGQPLDGTALTPLTTPAFVNPLLFTGARYDFEVGLYHLRSRYMDPIVGRFTTRDSIGIWGDKKNRGNGYTYAGCNPWTMIDPMGTDAMDFWNGCAQVCGFAIGAADNITFGAVSAVGEFVHGEEAWNEVLDFTQTSRAYGDAAATFVDAKSVVTAGFKGAVKGVDALAGIVSKGGDDLARLGDDAAKAADNASDASRAAGKVDTAATKGSPDIAPDDLTGKTPTEIREMADEKGLVPKGDPASPDYPRKWSDPATGNERLRLDKGHVDPKTGKPFDNPNAAADHAHGYGPDGKPIRDPTTGDKHFPTKKCSPK